MRRLYVLVRKDLSPAYQAVQAGHAVAQYMLDKEGWDNEILVYLHVEDEPALLEVAARLEWEGDPWVVFREPDLGGQATALAVLGHRPEVSKLMRGYRLLELSA